MIAAAMEEKMEHFLLHLLLSQITKFASKFVRNRFFFLSRKGERKRERERERYGNEDEEGKTARDV